MSEATPFDVDIHERLLDREPTASSVLCEAYLDEVRRRTAREAARFRLSPEEHEDVLVDAILSYCERPSQYQPQKKALLEYLVMSVYGDIRNAAKGHARRRSQIVPLDAVEHLLEARNSGQDGGADGVLSDDAAALQARVEAALPDPTDRRLAELIIDGRSTTAECAAILGITHLDSKEQAKTVNRHKDRIKKRLQRMGGRLRANE